MRSINKKIIRGILFLSYILIIGLITYGLSALFGYLNTGADRSTMLHTEIKKVEQFLPKIRWASLENEGRPMSDQTLAEIENDYLDAWYVKHVAYQTNARTGIKDYYTKNARKNLYNIINKNTEMGTTIKSTSLEHHPNLEFFSEDGHLIIITDKDVVEYKRIYKDKAFLLETKDVSTYKIIMLLEDGFWRIRHMLKTANDDYNPANKIISDETIDIKGINYYPQASPWDVFGKKFNLDTIARDFKLIKDTGLNSIRIFVPYEDFGKANVSPDRLNKLEQVMDTAEEENLKVVVTLFDFYGDYSILNWTLNQRHAETIVSKLKNHKALLAWDVKNEPNLDFESRGKDLVVAWLNNTIDLVKSIDSIHPVTIGWSNIESAPILKDKIDLITFHYYEDLNNLEKAYLDLKDSIPNKPIAITEFGMSSYKGLWNPLGKTEEDQASYHKQAQEIFSENNINYMSWTLYDFTDIPNEVTGMLPWRKTPQKYYGFINEKGDKKAAFKYIYTP
ncbi:glycoside hydrolase family 2 TIM barrel-domain containing protein [Flavivirga eckloniae]|uniref:Glycosyl hydrolase family 5 n=1 Tax=Flavivirga eckloniae TaxID=1803846 RepID=A0A2K9PLC2_9FLAO|nr:glycoside hydrolase family 2 TIM barrel-domain containing protein [Flavivirga eckloniae]AUP77638.1 glycosyl hydrolase family 5 [Flavivirga eckloniae]